jgi:hypothetical protein
LIYEFSRWKVPKKNSKERLRTMRAIYANIRTNRNRFSYIDSSRFFTAQSRNAEEETWINLDQYRNRDNYDRMTQALHSDMKAAELRRHWKSLIVPSSFRAELWGDLASELWILR